MLSKVVIPSLVIVSAGNAIITSESFNVSKCVGSYQDSVNFLYLNCYDQSGNFQERSSVLLPAMNSGSNSTAPVNGTSGSNSTAGSNSTSGSNSTAGSNSTSGSNSSAPSNSSAGSNSTAGGNSTTVVNNSTTVVDNSTTVDNSTVGTGRRLQEVNATTPEVNATTPDVNSTVPVVNATAPADNSTVGGNSSSGSNSSAGSNSTAGSNSSAGSNSTAGGSDGGVVAADQVNCCDYYEKGAGYEFSVCDGNIGAVIRQSLIGGERDRYWAMQQPDTLLGPVWTDLNNLVNNYCDQRQSAAAGSASNSTNGTTSANATQAWQQLDLPWAQWKNDIALSVDNLWVWLSRYQQYLGQAESFVNGGASAGSSASSGNASAPSNSTSDSSAQAVDFNGISYGSIVTEYNAIYAGFVQWYDLFFGQDGLVSVNKTVVYDGVVPVVQWDLNVTSFENNQGADVFQVESPVDLPYQLESIAEWINTKFGAVILENSCRICSGISASNSSVPVSNSTNATNSTGNSSAGNSSAGNSTAGNSSAVNSTSGNETAGNSTGSNSTVGGGSSTNSTVGTPVSTGNSSSNVNSTTTEPVSSGNTDTASTGTADSGTVANTGSGSTSDNGSVQP